MVGQEPTTEELLLRLQLVVEEIDGLLAELQPPRRLELDLPLHAVGLVLSALVGLLVGRL